MLFTLLSTAGPAAHPALGKVKSISEGISRMDSGQPLSNDHEDLSSELLFQFNFPLLLLKLLKKCYTTNV